MKNNNAEWRLTHRAVLVAMGILMLNCAVGFAQGDAAPADVEPAANTGGGINFVEMVRAGGAVGIIIILLSVALVQRIADHLMTIRRAALIPPDLADNVHKLIGERRYKQADKQCHENPSYLANVLSAGLGEVGLGYASVEKSMESASQEQASRLFRRIEYLSVIGTLAPMLGLLGTVWGMILAFVEFESKANPQVSELAPGIYKALVTTLLGLGVAVPALAAFAIFRNRIDELVAEATLTAESVFGDFKRASLGAKPRSKEASTDAARSADGARSAAPGTQRPRATGRRPDDGAIGDDLLQ